MTSDPYHAAGPAALLTPFLTTAALLCAAPMAAQPSALAATIASADSGSVSLLILYMLGALVVSHLCSILEATLLSTPMSFVTGLEAQGAKGWQRLKRMKADQDRAISAILVVNTIANTVGASLVGSEAAKLYGNAGVGIVSAVFTFLVLFISEIIPKTIGSSYWRGLAVWASGVIRFLIWITWPLVVILQLVTHLISGRSHQVSVSREDVAAMAATGAEEGALEKEENKMIQSLLKLDDITAREIMTPSSVVAMAESSLTIRDFYNSDEFRLFSRIPLYEDENDDYVTGYVLKQEVLEKMAEDRFNTSLKELARPILAFDEEETVGTIWEKMLESKEHISVIVDEYGSMRGIVTMEDVIETMLGYEIVDEKDEVVDMQELARSQWKQTQARHSTIQKVDSEDDEQEIPDKGEAE